MLGGENSSVKDSKALQWSNSQLAVLSVATKQINVILKLF